MKERKADKKSFVKTMLAASAVIGTSTLLFQGAIQAATEGTIPKTNIVATTYDPSASERAQSAPNSLPSGYKKANYTIRTINLEYYLNQAPTSKDMSREEAAEIGAQALWKIFNLNLQGQVIEMGYQQATENLPRSSWYADVVVNGKRSYSFTVDSVTGELFNISHERTLNKKVSVAFDKALDKNPQEYEALAKKLAEKHSVVQGKIKSAEYNGQGYSNNDPTISLDVTGEKGDKALMTFSRHDKALLGIVYHPEYKYVLESNEIFLKESQDNEKAETSEKANASANPDLTLKAK